MFCNLNLNWLRMTEWHTKVHLNLSVSVNKNNLIINTQKNKRCYSYSRTHLFLFQESSPQDLSREAEAASATRAWNLEAHHVGPFDQGQAFYQGEEISQNNKKSKLIELIVGTVRHCRDEKTFKEDSHLTFSGN